ncbi:NAD(P)-dependent oxidoreductase [Serratia marcescens]|uniref:NAD(P)-dependent oxidoreductase n=2 Tax=Serratia TaxID=613 RepID=UPI0029EA1D59|nr:NAD(P)H-binding protein [Serratia marcescens]HEJ8055417.1 NAD(P)H-binding protein [Serratia marcescens]
MKIAVVAATGRGGSTALAELIHRGHDVVAIARDTSKLPKNLPANVTVVKDDLSDEARLAAIIRGTDAVISAVGAPRDNADTDTDILVSTSAQVIDAVRISGVPRLLVVGGCGSLWYKDELKVVDSDVWPEFLVPIALSHMKLLTALRESSLNWTYVSPPLMIDLGERTGTYRSGSDELVVDKNGKSWISFEDYAIALVDELESPKHERERFSVGY